MRNKFYSLFIMIIILLLPYKLCAQKQGNSIGKVDVYSVTMLHPYMMWYDADRKAFKVKRDQKNKEIVTKIKEENAIEVARLEDEKNDIKFLMREEDQRYNQALGELSRKYVENQQDVGTATAELNKELYRRKIGDEKVRHNSRLNNLSGQYRICDEKINKLRYNLDEEYTTPVETENRFLEIIKDVKTKAKEIASKKGVSIVLNSGFRRLIPQNLNNPGVRSNIRNSFASVMTLPFPKEEIKDEGEMTVENYYKGIEVGVTNWLEKCSSVLGNAAKSIVEEDILVGGVDLTEDVVKAIYKSYKIDENITKAVVRCLKK